MLVRFVCLFVCCCLYFYLFVVGFFCFCFCFFNFKRTFDFVNEQNLSITGATSDTGDVSIYVQILQHITLEINKVEVELLISEIAGGFRTQNVIFIVITSPLSFKYFGTW